MPQSKYEYELGQGTFGVVYSCFCTEHANDPHIRRRDASFGAIIRGNVLMKTQVYGEITAGEGDVIYIPNGIICDTFWSGTPEIEYYSLHIFDAVVQSLPVWAPQRLDAGLAPAVGNNITKIYELMSNGQPGSQMRALAQIFGLLADIDGHMLAGSANNLPPVLLCALRYIEEHFKENIPISKLAAECYISESSLYHLFRSELNMTPNFYHISCRIDAAVNLLSQSELAVDEIAEAVGFSSSSYFCEMFRRLNGMAPGAYRKMMCRRDI